MLDPAQMQHMQAAVCVARSNRIQESQSVSK